MPKSDRPDRNVFAASAKSMAQYMENKERTSPIGTMPPLPEELAKRVGNGVRDFIVKDSGERQEYASGMVRDTTDGKPAFQFLMPVGVPFDAQMLTRIAAHMAKGAGKYGARNWEKADSVEEMERAKSSAFRHLIQWLAGETDEDHAAAVYFNVMFAETVKWKLENGQS